tara:strand:- start:2343 stop:3218 length:876 start_codon:yes stop_codon:yes gene_type:complete
LKLDKTIPEIEQRMANPGAEFDYLVEKYQNIAFNWKDWDGTPRKAEYLYATEGFITIPKNYDLEFVKSHYRGLITPNSKFKKMNENSGVEIHLVDGPGYYNNFWLPEASDFVSFSEKIDGLCALNNIYHTGMPGDIVQYRAPIFNSITVPDFIKHSYGKTKWGGEHYMGHPHRTPSSPDNLKIISKYKFCLCLEPMYHEVWSYDWLTERMLDCFKMKTIPFYYGCYNVEEKVPNELYVDLRKFKNMNDAILSIKNIGEKEYNEITDRAYEFYNDCKIGNILEIEKVLAALN